MQDLGGRKKGDGEPWTWTAGGRRSGVDVRRLLLMEIQDHAERGGVRTMKRLLAAIFVAGMIASVPLATGACDLGINNPRVTNDTTDEDGGGGPGNPNGSIGQR